MGRIQSNVGLASGINITSTVDQLMAVSSRSKTALETRVKGLQAQQVAINEITALVVGIQLQSDRIGAASSFTTNAVSSSKSDIVSAAISGAPAQGNYSVRVLQTAQTATASSAPLTSSNDTLLAGDFVVKTGGFVDSNIALDDLRGGVGISRGKIRITDRSGLAKEIDLRFSSTIDDTLKSINNAGLRVSAKADGDRIVLTDLSGQTISNLIVEEVGGGRTAADLGLSGINVNANSATGDDLSFLASSSRISTLRDGRGIAFGFGTDLSITLRDGTTLNIDVNSDKAPSNVGQLMAKVNAANADKLELRIRSNGDGLELVDKTTGSGAFVATGKLADQLGFTGVAGNSGSIGGSRIQSTLQGPLLSSLKGGQGLGTPGIITITNRQGTVKSVDMSGAQGLREVIDRINNSNSGVTASYNRSRTGIVVQDVTGGTSSNLIVADGDSNGTATKLGIAINAEKNSVEGGALDLQFVSEATELTRLNQGRGVRIGSFTITNASGSQKTVTLTPNTKTVADVLELVNSNTIGVQAKLNAQGDGITIVDTSTGSGQLTITDNQSGSSALDLGIRGTGTPKTSPARQEITGSQNFKLAINGTESITDVVKKINDANGPLTASLLTSGSSTVRLLLTSRATGDSGRFYADGEGIGLNINASGAARDSIVAVGSAEDSGGSLVRSSNNIVNNAIEGVALTLKGASPDPIDVTVSSNNSTLERNLQLFVDQYNKARDKIAKETEFNSDTGTTGLLIGSSEILRVEQALSRFITQRNFGSGKVQSLVQLGISANDKGKLEFDKEKLNKALASDPEDVKTFLTKETTGFGSRAKKLLDSLVGIKGSTLVIRSQTIQRQIESGTQRVETLTSKLSRERERLLNQFYKLEESISKIRGASTSLNDLQTVLTQFSSL
ncbi:MAG: flagellar filament capping protein FliD [Planctomycetota bacterium]|nr:flagellar filament capping protein FliD [Planctomycetota bacterium]